MTDRVELLVVARRAEAEWLGVDNGEYTKIDPHATDRLDAIIEDVLSVVADHLRQIGDISTDAYWRGLYRAADEVRGL